MWADFTDAEREPLFAYLTGTLVFQYDEASDSLSAQKGELKPLPSVERFVAWAEEVAGRQFDCHPLNDDGVGAEYYDASRRMYLEAIVNKDGDCDGEPLAAMYEKWRAEAEEERRA